MKIQEYELKRLGQQIVDFHDDLRDLISNGKYAHPIVSAVPSWNADNGEMVFYDSLQGTTDRRIYVRLSSSWVVFAQIIGPGSGPGTGPVGPEGAVQFNSGGVFGGESRFVYDSSRKSLDVFGHLAVGSNSTVDNVTAGLDNGYFLAAGSGYFLVNGIETFRSNTVLANAGIKISLISSNNSNVTDVNHRTIAGNFEVDVPSVATTTQGNLYAIAGNVNQSAAIPTHSIYGGFLRASLGNNNAKLRTGQEAVGLKVVSNWDPYDSGTYATNAFTLKVIDENASVGEPTYNGAPGLFIGPHQQPTSNQDTGHNRFRFNLLSWAVGGYQTYNECLNDFAAPLYIGGQLPTAKVWAALHLEQNAHGFGFAGSGTFSGSAGSTTMVGISTDFGRDLVPQNSVPPPAVAAYPGTYVQASGVFLQISSISSSTQLTLTEPLGTAIPNGTTFTIYRPALLIESEGVTSGEALFVVTKQGRVGINTRAPLDALHVTGNIRVSGKTITGADTTSIVPAGVFFTTTAIGIASNNASELTLVRGIVGTTSLVANTLSEGRTIRLYAAGYFNTPLIADNITMRVKLGGTTVLTTEAQTPVASASSLLWELRGLVTCWTTGGAGTVFAQGETDFHSSITAINAFEMVNSSTIVLNTTGANVVEITAQWGAASSSSQLFMTTCVGELLN